MGASDQHRRRRTVQPVTAHRSSAPPLDIPERIQVVLGTGDDILVLDGPVLEAFHGPSAASRRWHVNHVKAASKPQPEGTGATVFIGVMVDRRFPDPWKIEVSDTDLARIESLMAVATSRTII